jgi:hypothetical protein
VLVARIYAGIALLPEPPVIDALVAIVLSAAGEQPTMGSAHLEPGIFSARMSHPG